MTRAFTTSGAVRFDALGDIVKSFPKELDGLSWDNRYDPRLQLRAMILKDLQTWNKVLDTKTERDRLAMALAAYNGGLGGLQSDRRVCSGTPGCDPGRWFGHVEHTSLKAKTAVPGYGKPFFVINREYPYNILGPRRQRYLSLDA